MITIQWNYFIRMCRSGFKIIFLLYSLFATREHTVSWARRPSVSLCGLHHIVFWKQMRLYIFCLQHLIINRECGNIQNMCVISAGLALIWILVTIKSTYSWISYRQHKWRNQTHQLLNRAPAAARTPTPVCCKGGRQHDVLVTGWIWSVRWPTGDAVSNGRNGWRNASSCSGLI